MATGNTFQHESYTEIFAANEVIFREGEPGEAMYVIQEGEVDLWLNDHLLETAGPGDIFGEMALLDPTARNVTAIARTGCRIVPLSQTRFKVHVHHTPYFAIQVMRVMVDRLRRMNQ
jgi:CRP/FNR family transcriptional regulator, cyclic AMP receptor protein